MKAKYIIVIIVILLILLICCLPLTLCTLSAFLPSSDNVKRLVSMDSETLGFEEKVVHFTGDLESNSSNRIAVIDISGMITYKTDFDYPDYGNSGVINAALNKAYSDDSVKLVLLKMNTPGGEVAAAESICNTIRKVDEKKPVYAFVDSEAASLGYLLANCTRYIYSTPLSITASIGVISIVTDIYGIIEKVGGKVSILTNTNGKSKAGGGLFDENSEGYKSFKTLLDQTFDKFVNYVYEGRQRSGALVSKDEIKRIADGRVMSGLSAKELGLVDELSEYHEIRNKLAIKESLGANPEMIEYKLPMDPFSQIFKGIGLVAPSLNNQNSIRLLMQTSPY